MEVISKKELLELTGISYGQLYRWKRKNIIPESWFIKKSSFTGQETYFPREKILERIDKIVEMKDTHSLDELSNFFSPNPTEVKLPKEDLKAILNEETFKLWNEVLPTKNVFQFQDILCLYISEKLVQSKKFSRDECLEALKFLHKSEMLGELVGIRKNHTLVWMQIRNKADLVIEEQAEATIEINILEYINKLKIKLSEF